MNPEKSLQKSRDSWVLLSKTITLKKISIWKYLKIMTLISSTLPKIQKNRENWNPLVTKL